VVDQKRKLILWPERFLGPPPGLKELNLICWGLFIGFVIAPIFFVVLIQSRTGRLYFRQTPVDFIYLYGTGRIANEHSVAEVYDNNLQLKTFNEIQVSRDGVYGTSPYPPFVSQFFRLFAKLPFEPAYFLWMGISLTLYVAAIALTLREVFPGESLKSSLFFCFALAYYPFLRNTLANGQLSCVAVLSVAVAVFQEKRSRPFLSGLALALLAYKPTLLLLLIPMLLLTRRFRAFFGFMAGAGILVAISTALAGIQIWPAYVRFLVDFGHASGLSGHSSLELWKYVDFNSLSYAIPGGRSVPGLAILICFSAIVTIWLAVLLWKSSSGGKTEQYLAWAATLTWTMLLNVYFPIYDSILVTIAVILTIGAIRDLAWINTKDWIVFWAILIFGVSWITEGIAETYGIQLLSIALLVLGIAQCSILHRAIRRSPQIRSALGFALPAGAGKVR
jgi:Glycosyltransferase family 87